jgi:hypothetical protein
MELQEIEKDLSSTCFSKKINPIRTFLQFKDNIRKLFKKVLGNFNPKIRREATKNLILTPSCVDQFLDDPDPKVRFLSLNHSLHMCDNLNWFSSISNHFRTRKKYCQFI